MRGREDGRDQTRRPDPIGAHVHRLLGALAGGDQGLHRLGIFGPKIKDVPHFDAARGDLSVGRNLTEIPPVALCISGVCSYCEVHLSTMPCKPPTSSKFTSAAGTSKSR